MIILLIILLTMRVGAVWMLAALLAAGPGNAGAPPAPLEVAGVFVTAAGAWSALDSSEGRLTLRCAAGSAAPALDVRVVLQGSACARAHCAKVTPRHCFV